MRRSRHHATVLLIMFWAGTLCAAQSLGDVARQQRLQKKTASPTAHHVITDEDIPAQKQAKQAEAPAPAAAQEKKTADAESEAATNQQSKEQRANELQAKIKEEKQRILNLEAHLKKLQGELDKWKTSDCTYTVHREDTSKSGCDIPGKLLAENEKSRTQLEHERAALVEMQEEVRRLGYGNSFYDPE